MFILRHPLKNAYFADLCVTIYNSLCERVIGLGFKKYSQVIGFPVICVDKGRKAGVVKDMFFCRKNRTVDAILVEKDGCLSSLKVLNYKDIDDFGDDAVLVKDLSSLKKTDRKEIESRLKYSNLKGMQIFSRDGQELGVVSDILFNVKTGIVEGLIVSEGLIQDIMTGRSTIVLIGKEEFSNEYVLVEKESAEEMIKGKSIMDLLKNKHE